MRKYELYTQWQFRLVFILSVVWIYTVCIVYRVYDVLEFNGLQLPKQTRREQILYLKEAFNSLK